MTFIEVVALVGIPVAGAMAFAMGANDVSNALGTSVGSGALTIRQAVILGGIFEFLGTIIMGRFVTGTIKSGVLDVEAFAGEMDKFALGMFCALVAATAWLLIATYFSLPVSTTHTVVGGILGFGLVEKGLKAVKGWEMLRILGGWLLSPFLGTILSFLLFLSIHRSVLINDFPHERSIKLLPIFAALTMSILGVFILVSEAPLLKIPIPWWVNIIAFVVIFIVSGLIVKLAIVIRSRRKKLKKDDYDSSEDLIKNVPYEEIGAEAPDTVEDINNDMTLKKAEENFKILMIIGAVIVAFAHGSNDVSNAVGPVAALWEYRNTGTISTDGDGGNVPFWLLLLGGVGIVLGVGTLGHRVMKTVGEKITKLNHPRGFAAQLSTATTVLLASLLGLPISTTHTSVGSVTGTGIVPGSTSAGGINRKMLWKILAGWIVTIFAGCLGTVLLYLLLRIFLEEPVIVPHLVE